jgi:hypothetical protein
VLHPGRDRDDVAFFEGEAFVANFSAQFALQKQQNLVAAPVGFGLFAGGAPGSSVITAV